MNERSEEAAIRPDETKAGQGPRKKVPPGTGFSHIDWVRTLSLESDGSGAPIFLQVRLQSSGQDLAGLGGRYLKVTKEELMKHNRVDDCWMVLRGKVATITSNFSSLSHSPLQVYNVTPYLRFHPGGVEELMRGAGRDATRLFGEYPLCFFRSTFVICFESLSQELVPSYSS